MKVDKHTTLVGYAEAINETVEDLSKLVKRKYKSKIQLRKTTKLNTFLIPNLILKLEIMLPV